MEKNVLIIHYNTQKITNACIMSINKTTPGCKIYIFDNSDTVPFCNHFENVTVIDNTSGQTINFDLILEKHKNSSTNGAKDNNFGSYKHCLSVDVAMSIIDGGFVLMDSDILLKKDFSCFYDETIICAGKTEKLPHLRKRIAPYMMYINTKMCKEHNIHFFNEEHMFGLNGKKGEEIYDTGCWFYETCKDLPKKEINVSQYMIHFRAASWYKDAVEKQHYKQITPEKWLEKNKHYWYEELKPVITPDVSETATTEPEEEKAQPKATIKSKNKAVSFRSLEALRKSGGDSRKIYLRKA